MKEQASFSGEPPPVPAGQELLWTQRLLKVTTLQAKLKVHDGSPHPTGPHDHTVVAWSRCGLHHSHGLYEAALPLVTLVTVMTHTRVNVSVWRLTDVWI